MDDDELRAGELTTANYGWIKPTVGDSDDAWGGYLNSDLDGIDTTVHGVSTVANAAYPASNPAGYITAAAIPAAYVLPTASTSVLGGVKVDGSTITIDGTGKISGASASITISDTAPSSPSAGALWYDSVGGQLYVWYADPNTSQWVPATNQMGGGYMPLQGVINGSDAPAGQIGEIISSIVLAASGVSLANGSIFNIASIALTPGDWDVYGELWFSGAPSAGTTVQAAWGAISTSASSLTPATAISLTLSRVGGPITCNINNVTYSTYSMVCRASVSAATNYYMNAQLNFSAGTGLGFGKLWARRAR